MRSSPSPLRRLLALAILVSSAAAPSEARASSISFGPDDVPTVFFISKSDDHNRVDYGIRLDAHCAPAGEAPVFPYWREFEHAPPVRTHPLSLVEHVAYGISEQQVLRRDARGGEVTLRLRQLGRPVLIRTGRGPDGRCTATAFTRVGGLEGAELLSVFAQLGHLMSVAYVDVHGRDPATGAARTERVLP